MNSSQQLAKHLKEVFYGGNWTDVNFKENLNDISWEKAISEIDGLNTIAKLTFHIGYFVEAILPVLQGEKINANDKFSYDHPPINSQADWEKLVNGILANVNRLNALIESIPENQLWDVFEKEKYGTYYRNILGLIEHTHYHLGQISLLKKLIR